ncbi:MAG: 4Fe-4S binding protein [Anaerolineae bacterium]|nr:4Fe-4S binding protein [Anaerolineae bacterium]
MKIGSMVGDVFRSLFQRSATRQYPFDRKDAPDRLRGKLHWDPEKCTGCLLCVKDCPAQAIEIIMVDKANKRFAMRYHLDRCAFCSQCVVSCRAGALEMSKEEWELAAAHKGKFMIYSGDEADVKRLVELAQAHATGTEDK